MEWNVTELNVFVANRFSFTGKKNLLVKQIHEFWGKNVVKQQSRAIQQF